MARKVCVARIASLARKVCVARIATLARIASVYGAVRHPPFVDHREWHPGPQRPDVATMLQVVEL